MNNFSSEWLKKWRATPDPITVGLGGQSNASGYAAMVDVWQYPADRNELDKPLMMYNNSNEWKKAAEPLDLVTPGDPHPDELAGHSFGCIGTDLLCRDPLRAGNVIPSCWGGTSLQDWLDNKANLITDSVERWNAKDIDILWWFQGESDAVTPDLRYKYAENTLELFNRFFDGMGRRVPIILMQLASTQDNPDWQQGYAAVTEAQRNLELYYDWITLVTTFDLPQQDVFHLDRDAMTYMGHRVQTASRVVLGLLDDPSVLGPRLAESKNGPKPITASGSTVTVQLTQKVFSNATDANGVFPSPATSYFQVFTSDGSYQEAPAKEVRISDDQVIIELEAALDPNVPTFAQYGGNRYYEDAPSLIDPILRVGATQLESPFPKFGPYPVAIG